MSRKTKLYVPYFVREKYQEQGLGAASAHPSILQAGGQHAVQGRGLASCSPHPEPMPAPLSSAAERRGMQPPPDLENVLQGLSWVRLSR